MVGEVFVLVLTISCCFLSMSRNTKSKKVVKAEHLEMPRTKKMPATKQAKRKAVSDEDPELEKSMDTAPAWAQGLWKTLTRRVYVLAKFHKLKPEKFDRKGDPLMLRDGRSPCRKHLMF